MGVASNACLHLQFSVPLICPKEKKKERERERERNPLCKIISRLVRETALTTMYGALIKYQAVAKLHTLHLCCREAWGV